MDNVIPQAPRVGNPLAAGPAVLAFQLIIFGAQWWNISAKTVAESPMGVVNGYATAVAALVSFIVGTICLLRADTYAGKVNLFIGAWLLTAFLTTHDKNVTPTSVEWLFFAIVVPLLVITIPAVVHRNYPFLAAFGGILAVVVSGGVAFKHLASELAAAEATKAAPHLDGVVTTLHITGIFGFLTAAAMLFLSAHELLAESGVLPAREPAALAPGAVASI